MPYGVYGVETHGQSATQGLSVTHCEEHLTRSVSNVKQRIQGAAVGILHLPLFSQNVLLEPLESITDSTNYLLIKVFEGRGRRRKMY